MDSNLPTIRVIFVGDTNVGKTALNIRYLNGEFNEECAPTLSPSSANSHEKTVNGEEVNLQLWDTAGQEKFKAMSQVFYRDANVACVCADASNLDTFKSIAFWKNCVLEVEPVYCKFVLAVTKIDLVADQGALTKAVDEAKKQYDIQSCIFTSSKTGEGINNLFTEVATIGYQAVCHKEATISTKPKEQSVDINKKSDKSDKKGCC